VKARSEGSSGDTRSMASVDSDPSVAKLVAGCTSNAEDLLKAANHLQKEGMYSIAYGMAALSLEEVGKSELLEITHLVQKDRSPPSWPSNWSDDHVKKLFWALWSPAFGREAITKDLIESRRGLASKIHETRLLGLYAPIDDSGKPVPREVASQDASMTLIKMAEARLKLQASKSPRKLQKDDKVIMDWFLTATDDPERRVMILGPKSMEKWAELGDSIAWMSWLKDQFDQADMEGLVATEREKKRPEPSGDEPDQPKWKVRIRLVSQSHSVRREHLAWWNEIQTWIKFYPVSGKPNHLDVEFSFSKSVSVLGLWDLSFGVSQKLVAALNIGTGGVFWWKFAEHISRFYESITDLENPGLELKLERSPALKIGWPPAVLDQGLLANVAACLTELPSPAKQDRSQFVVLYLMGVGLMAKNDIHLRFEGDAYRHFFEAMKIALQIYGGWDGKGDFKPHFMKLFEKFRPSVSENERDRYYQLGGIPVSGVSKNRIVITLTDVVAMKLLCDGYLLRTFAKIANSKIKGE